MEKKTYTPTFTAQVNSMFGVSANQITIELLVSRGIITIEDAISIYGEVVRRSLVNGGEVNEAVAVLAQNAMNHYVALARKPEAPPN